MIQACQQQVSAQSSSTQQQLAVDAGGGYPTVDLQSNQHIVLTRPHTLLLLVTVCGGTAMRGVFCGAIAESFLDSKKERHIYELYRDAVKTVVAARPGQIPELRSTLTKDLIITPFQL